MNEKQKELLKRIMNDNYAKGPFAGMIFNAMVTTKEDDVDKLIKTALNVRLRLEELSEWKK